MANVPNNLVRAEKRGGLEEPSGLASRKSGRPQHFEGYWPTSVELWCTDGKTNGGGNQSTTKSSGAQTNGSRHKERATTISDHKVKDKFNLKSHKLKYKEKVKFKFRYKEKDNHKHKVKDRFKHKVKKKKEKLKVRLTQMKMSVASTLLLVVPKSMKTCLSGLLKIWVRMTSKPLIMSLV